MRLTRYVTGPEHRAPNARRPTVDASRATTTRRGKREGPTRAPRRPWAATRAPRRPGPPREPRAVPGHDREPRPGRHASRKELVFPLNESSQPSQWVARYAV
jgi:hypothetical protein